MASRRSTFGMIRTLPSGRHQASYLGPDRLRHTGPRTFTAKKDAAGWLAGERVQIERQTWTPPSQRESSTSGQSVAQFARERVEARTLTERTREHYRSLVRLYVEGTGLGAMPLTAVRTDHVERWYRDLVCGPTAHAHAYALLHSVMADALRLNRRSDNPCRLRGAQNSKSKARIRALDVAQLRSVVDAAPEGYRAAIALAGTCTLRAGELKGLRRADIAPDGSSVEVKRAVTYRSGKYVVGQPKTDAGLRVISVPAFVRPILVAHLATIERAGTTNAFPSRSGHPFMSDWEFRDAVARAGRSVGLDGSDADHRVLRPHELRHTAGTLAAHTGATIAELMARLGHDTPAMSIRYQQASTARDERIADSLSAMFD